MMEYGKIFVSIVQVVRICQERLCTDYLTLNFEVNFVNKPNFPQFQQQSSEGIKIFPAVRQSIHCEKVQTARGLNLRLSDKWTSNRK
jgi:hypothetical protein